MALKMTAGGSRFVLPYSFFLFVQLLLIATEAKVLEDKHDLAIRSLTEENQNLKSSLAKFQEELKEIKETLGSPLRTAAIQKTTKHFPMARTCYELTRSDPTVESGMHYIDPDGWNAGDSPIYVYCDKATGETNVLHDSLEKTDVGHCLDPGCYTRSVIYNASMRQMKALMELSPTCDQYIRYDCVSAVFAFNDVQYSWWNDRQGEEKYYWNGNDDSVHTCSCGTNGTCLEPTSLCNCDAAAGIPEYDEGFISNKQHLPISRLNFGRIPSYAIGEHTLGPLRCNGNYQSSSNIPSSCADQWRSGETISGLYQLKASDNTIVTVFCDMGKLPGETGHQTFIGTSDVKSTLVYFSVVRENSLETSPWDRKTIQYDSALLNKGNAINITTGKFTPPRKGIYYFSFTLASSVHSLASINRNGAEVVRIESCNDSYVHSSSAHATLELNLGDIVETVLFYGNLISNGAHQTHFTGYMLQEL